MSGMQDALLEATAFGVIPVAFPEEAHAMIDVSIRPVQPEQVRDGEAVHHARRVVELPFRAAVARTREVRGPIIGEREEAATRVEAGRLEEVEQRARLRQQPMPVHRAVHESRSRGAHPPWRSGHALHV